MPSENSFELFIYDKSAWNIDSVYDEQGAALFEARLLFEEPSAIGVKVIQVGPDENGVVGSKVIYQKVNRANLAKAISQKSKEVKKKPEPKPTAPGAVSVFFLQMREHLVKNLLIFSSVLVFFAIVLVFVRAFLRGF